MGYRVVYKKKGKMYSFGADEYYIAKRIKEHVEKDKEATDIEVEST